MNEHRVVYIVVTSTKEVQHFVTDLNITGLAYDDDWYVDLSKAENPDDALLYDLLLLCNNTALFSTDTDDVALERIAAVVCVLSSLGAIKTETVRAFFDVSAEPSAADLLASYADLLASYEADAITLAGKYSDTEYVPDGAFKLPAEAELYVLSVASGF